MKKSFRSLSAFVLSAAFACGGDGGPSAGEGGMFAPDAAVAGDPSRIEIALDPARAVYRPMQEVRADVTVWEDDTEIEVPLRWEVRPDGAARDEGEGRFTFLEEGTVEIEACALRRDGRNVCDYARVLVDAGAPNLEVEAPLPGAELGGDGASRIEVRGSIADTRTTEVFVNGKLASVDERGGFRVEVEPRFGVNHLEVVASDGVNEESRTQMDVLWADAYLPALAEDGRPEVVLEEGMALQLGQRFFDDGQPFEAGAMPARAEDLADILELVVSELDFGSLLPDPVVDSAALRLRITDTRIRDLDVAVDIVEGGAEVFVRVGALDADTEGILSFEGTELDLGGGLTAAASIFASVEVRKESPEAEVEAEIGALEVAIESIDGRFESEEANAIVRLAEGSLRGSLEEALAGGLEGALLSALPAILGDAFRALDTVLRDRTIEIDTDLFSPVTLLLDGRLRSIEIAPRAWMRAPLRFSVGTAEQSLQPLSRGVADLAGEGLPLFESRGVQLGVRLAVLNGLLHALWSNGLLDIDASALLPENLAGLVEEATLVGRLPPVLRLPRGEENEDLVLSLGQAELEAVVLGQRIRFGLRLEAGVRVGIADGLLAMQLAEVPEVHAWLIESEAARPPIDEEALEELVREQLWPPLRDAVGNGLSLELPGFEVGDLTALAPDLEGFEVQLELADRLRPRDRWLVLELSVIGTTPPTMVLE